MTAQQLIKEALYRLKRSGERHIFLSVESRDQIKTWSQLSSETHRQSNQSESAQSHGLKTSENTRSFLPELPQSNKADRMIALKESYQSFLANEKLLFGQGSHDAKLIFLSECPSADEFAKNTLYTGEVQKLMQKIFAAMEVDSSEVYSTSLIKSQTFALKWMQNPEQASTGLKHSLEYLNQELSILQPEVIVLLGASAYATLYKDTAQSDSFQSVQGKQLSYRGIDLIPTVHPRHLLLKDTLESKHSFWQAMLAAMQRLDLPISEVQRNYFKKR